VIVVGSVAVVAVAEDVSVTVPVVVPDAEPVNVTVAVAEPVNVPVAVTAPVFVTVPVAV
jgi:hypothetical protein